MIEGYDSYGRKLYMTRQQWRDNVLLGNLEKARGNPEQLYDLLLGALTDGFAADLVSYAEELHRVDSVPERGATILAIVYMQSGRLDDAERVLKSFLARYALRAEDLTAAGTFYGTALARVDGTCRRTCSRR
jgi:hypothetical protein